MNYEHIRSTMLNLITKAQQVINETEKEMPDDILIMDIAVEEIEALLLEMQPSIFRLQTLVDDFNINE